MKHTYLLPAPPPTECAWSHHKKKFRWRLYNFLCQTPGSLNQISPDLYKMYRNDCRLLCWNQNCDRPICFGTPSDEWRSSSNCGQIAAKNTSFNSVNSEITGWKFTKFVQDIAGLLSLNILKAAWQSANSLSNARAKSKGLSAQRLRTSSKFNYLP